MTLQFKSWPVQPRRRSDPALADIKASDQTIFYPKHMTAHLVGQQFPHEVARGQVDLDGRCSVRADREADWLGVGIDCRPCRAQ
jgi:hypothetical protein